MDFVKNEPEQIEIRRNQNTLIVVGTGTILFSVWSVVKMLGMFFILKSETIDAFRAFFEETPDVSDRVIFWFAFVVTIILLAVTLTVRLYIGRSAIAEGRGRRRGNLYLILAAILIISGISTICSDFYSEETPMALGALTRSQSLSTKIIDLTSIVMSLEMVIASLRIRKLRGKPKHAKR